MAMRPPLPSVILSRRAKIALAVVAILIVLLILLVKLSGVYINYLWFGEVGHRNVYSTMLWTRVSLFFIFGVLMARDHRRQPDRRLPGAAAVPADVARAAEPAELRADGRAAAQAHPRRRHGHRVARRGRVRAGRLGRRGSCGSTAARSASDGPAVPPRHLVLRVGLPGLPAPAQLRLHRGHLLAARCRSPSTTSPARSGCRRPGPKITLAARRHLTVLVFVFMALKAVAYWLDRYGLVFSDRSKFTGASYTDVHSALPAKTILFWITIILALGVLASIWLRSVLLPGIGFVVLLVLSILISGIYPAIVQQVSVKPERQRQGSARTSRATSRRRGRPTTSSPTRRASDRHGELPAVPGDPVARHRRRSRHEQRDASTTSASSTRTSSARRSPNAQKIAAALRLRPHPRRRPLHRRQRDDARLHRRRARAGAPTPT